SGPRRAGSGSVRGDHRLPASDGGHPRRERRVPGGPGRGPAGGDLMGIERAPRRAVVERSTREATVRVTLSLDGEGRADAATAPAVTLHGRRVSGRSPHNVVEAEFKALARALGDACASTGRAVPPSTKGSLG